jgi:hypothetical protein
MLHVLLTPFFIIEMPTEYKAKSTNHVFSILFFKLCPSQVLYSGKGKKWEIEPKQEVKMTDNLVNKQCVALFLVCTVACQALVAIVKYNGLF